jgi:hypothetical protein
MIVGFHSSSLVHVFCHDKRQHFALCWIAQLEILPGAPRAKTSIGFL